MTDELSGSDLEGAAGPEVSGPGARRGPFQDGEQAVLYDDRGRRRMVRLKAGHTFHTNQGTLPHDAILGQDEGCRVQTHKGRWLVCLRPTLEEYVMEMPRQTQIIYPKDLGSFLIKGQVSPGARVFQSGIGSGALAVTLLRFLGPTGLLVSYEVRPEFASLAEMNIRRFLGADPPNHQLEVRDIYAGIDVRDMDTVILDIPDPTPCVDAAANALRPGGVLMVWLPTVLQVHQLVCALRADRRYDLVETTEMLLRPWYVTRISMRPEHRMVAHTGFLITARRCLPRPEIAAEPAAATDDAADNEGAGEAGDSEVE